MKLEIALHEDLLYKFFHALVEQISQGRNFYSPSQHPREINMKTNIYFNNNITTEYKMCIWEKYLDWYKYMQKKNRLLLKVPEHD